MSSVAAIVAVNALGSVYDPINGDPIALPRSEKRGMRFPFAGTNTTIGVIATTARLESVGVNRLASIGPDVEGGVILSGHTDVVPVDGQLWTSDPWTLTRRDDGLLYGRGTCDMKGFVALALAAIPEFKAARLSAPIHLAFSYDEEVGCLGAPDLIKAIAAQVPSPRAVIVGEPTDMEAVSGHKGIASFKVSVMGHEVRTAYDGERSVVVTGYGTLVQNDLEQGTGEGLPAEQ